MAANYQFLIDELVTWVNIGVSQEERSQSQAISWSIKIFFEKAPKACLSDDINDTICYETIVKLLCKTAKSQEYKLLEHLTQAVFDELTKLVLLPLEISAYKRPAAGTSYRATFSIRS